MANLGITTRPLFQLTLQVSSVLTVGATPAAFRRIGLVTGGTFVGERLAGEVISGNDWQEIRTDYGVTLDVRLVLKTNDGALIAITYRGLRCGPPEVLAQIDRGEAVDPASYYFRISAQFETSAERYGWLNRIIAVGTGERRPTGPVYTLFELL